MQQWDSKWQYQNIHRSKDTSRDQLPAVLLHSAAAINRCLMTPNRLSDGPSGHLIRAKSVAVQLNQAAPAGTTNVPHTGFQGHGLTHTFPTSGSPPPSTPTHPHTGKALLLTRSSPHHVINDASCDQCLIITRVTPAGELHHDNLTLWKTHTHT